MTPTRKTLDELRGEILDDHAEHYAERSELLDTPDIVVLDGLKKVEKFVDGLHPAVREALNLECPGTHEDKGGLSSWTNAPRHAIQTLYHSQELPSGVVIQTLWRKKNLRGGPKQHARNEFLVRLARLLWQHSAPALERTRAGTAEYREEMLEFLRKAARDARPRVECPKTWDGLARILPPGLHEPPVLDLRPLLHAARGFRASYPPRDRSRDNAEVYLERLQEHLRDRGLPSPALDALRRILRREGLHEPRWKPKPARGRA